LSTMSKNSERLFEKFILPNIGNDMPIYRLTAFTASLELFDQRRINRLLQARYNFISQMQNEETKIIGIVVGTVVVNEYMTLINKLK